MGASAARTEEVQHQALSAAAITLQPKGINGLTLGLARSVYTPVGERADAVGQAARVITDWSGEPNAASNDSTHSAQLIALFGRWVLPSAGVEIYGEWARHELPHSIRDFLLYPNRSRGYTAGLQWTREIGQADRLLRVQSEITNLEQDATYRLRPLTSFYVSRSSSNGYTNEGHVIGAAIGPGSSSQWLSLDLFTPIHRFGIFGERIRWNNDAYLTTPSPWPFLGHDVSIRGGVRGGTHISGWSVDAEIGFENRMNYMFQNWATSWEAAAHDAINVPNWELQLRVTPVLE
jgi:hypothetical protein